MKISKIEHITVYMISIIFMIFILMPIYNMIITSFKPFDEVWTTSYLPLRPTFEAYYEVFTQSYFRVQFFWTQMWNSARIAFGVMGLSIFLAICTGYVISKRVTSRLKSGLRTLTLLAYIFPASFLSIPLFRLMGMYGLLDSDYALIFTLGTLVTPYASWIMAEYFDNIPKQIDEAAMIDGASQLTIITRIILPLSIPAIIAIMTYAFMYSWNSYLYPLIMLNSVRNLTLPVSMGFFLSSDDAPWNIFNAVGLTYSIPAVILYYAFRRYLVTGLFRGAVKA